MRSPHPEMRLAVFTSQFPGRINTFFARDMRALLDAGTEVDVFPLYPLDRQLWAAVPDCLHAKVLPRDRVHHLDLRRALPAVAGTALSASADSREHLRVGFAIWSRTSRQVRVCGNEGVRVGRSVWPTLRPCAGLLGELCRHGGVRVPSPDAFRCAVLDVSARRDRPLSRSGIPASKAAIRRQHRTRVRVQPQLPEEPLS